MATDGRTPNRKGGDSMRYFVHEWKQWGLRVALFNLRWNFAYRLGGFTSASKDF
jgi:hypothetical protein